MERYTNIAFNDAYLVQAYIERLILTVYLNLAIVACQIIVRVGSVNNTAYFRLVPKLKQYSSIIHLWGF